MKTLKQYLRALNHGKELERLTIIQWLESIDENDRILDDASYLEGIIDALKESLHKRRD